ncbi:MAG: hypothetical protein AAF458_13760 [Pseudomonadota bacterium]
MAVPHPVTEPTFHTTINERVDNIMQFNVMPDRPVTETLHIREYRIADDYIEAHFDRSYKSSMLKSPSHLIFLSAVAHYQKIIYVYACNRLGLGYDPSGPEVLKIWPTVVNVEMPRMIRNETDLVHRVYFDAFDELAPKRYHLKTHSDVNECVYISGESPLYVL